MGAGAELSGAGLGSLLLSSLLHSQEAVGSRGQQYRVEGQRLGQARELRGRASAGWAVLLSSEGLILLQQNTLLVSRPELLFNPSSGLPASRRKIEL